MKAKQGFELRTVASEQVIVATGAENIDFSKIISLNNPAAYLWTMVADKEFTAEELAELLTEKYEVDRSTAYSDSVELVRLWLEAGIVNE